MTDEDIGPQKKRQKMTRTPRDKKKRWDKKRTETEIETGEGTGIKIRIIRKG